MNEKEQVSLEVDNQDASLFEIGAWRLRNDVDLYVKNFGQSKRISSTQTEANPKQQLSNFTYQKTTFKRRNSGPALNIDEQDSAQNDRKGLISDQIFSSSAFRSSNTYETISDISSSSQLRKQRSGSFVSLPRIKSAERETISVTKEIR
jgi:hypothetical protein